MASQVSRDDALEFAGGERPEAEADDPSEPERPSVLAPGVYVARYRILDVVGTGGIGVVYSAFDDALGRNVALKLLRPSARSSRKFERRRARLVREAQALARLSHPNVVPIYEVGMFEERVFLAMEYVEGSTIRRWLRRQPRSWEEIIDKYAQAGRGLAAAHQADIVHRDFKPDNVLVGEDGRVRVLDFGLATPVPDALATGRYPTLASPDHDTSPNPLTESVASLVTGHGKVMGTPAYMAPEQSRGETIDARADQYSFCVSLWEALFGERPQGPPSATARVRLHRRLTERGSARADVPPFVARALERGLSLDPADRFANMDQLLAALVPKPARWRWRGLAVALPSIAVVAGLVGVLRPDAEQLCPRELAALDGVWDAQLQASARARVGATARPHASATWDAIEHELERWSTRWLDARVDACEDTKLRAEQSQLLLDVRMACLDRQRNALATVTESFRAEVVHTHELERQLEIALTAVLDLPDPQRCERSALVGGALLLDRDAQLDEVLESARDELASARGLRELASLDEALALVDGVLALVEARGRSGDALLAEAKLERGQILAATGSFADAEDDLRQALFLAQRIGHDTVTVEACAALVALLVELDALDSADDWAALGHATLTRLGGDPYLEATLRLAGAELALARGSLDLALRDQGRVLELREQLYGPDHLEIAHALLELAPTQARLGLHPEAEANIVRALDLLTAQLGLAHPQLGLAHVQHAALLRARGEDREALSKLLDALAIFELAHDEHHPRVAETYAALAATHEALGQRQLALDELARARQISAALHGANHPKLLPLLVDAASLLRELEQPREALAQLELAAAIAANSDLPGAPRARAEIAAARGALLLDEGRFDEAKATFHVAAQNWSNAVGPLDARVALALGHGAVAAHLGGDPRGALDQQREALRIHEAALAQAPEPEARAHELSLHLSWIGIGLVTRDELAEAEEPLTRALALLEGRRDEGDQGLRARTKLALAEVLWSRAESRPRARELARAAIGAYTQLGADAELRAAKTWLRQHGG